MQLICIHGAPGVGKLSVGRELEQASGSILLHDHLAIDAAVAVFPFGEPKFSALRSSIFSTLLEAACAAQASILLTHANDVFWQPAFRSIVLDCALRHGYPVRRVFLQCDPVEHARRISDPSRALYRKIGNIERLRRLTAAGEFRPPNPEPGDLTIDTTHLTPLEVATEIAASVGLIWRRLKVG